jgi:hypothetical protein
MANQGGTGADGASAELAALLRAGDHYHRIIRRLDALPGDPSGPELAQLIIESGAPGAKPSELVLLFRAELAHAVAPGGGANADEGTVGSIGAGAGAGGAEGAEGAGASPANPSRSGQAPLRCYDSLRCYGRGTVRAWLLQLRLRANVAFDAWERRKGERAVAEKGALERQFGEALAGREHSLTPADLDALVAAASPSILPPAFVAAEASWEAAEWARTLPGKAAVRVRAHAMRRAVGRGCGSGIAREAREALVGERVAAFEAEAAASPALAQRLLREYRGTPCGVDFTSWLQLRAERRSQQKSARRQWRKQKAAASKQDKAQALESAPAPLLREQLERLLLLVPPHVRAEGGAQAQLRALFAAPPAVTATERLGAAAAAGGAAAAATQPPLLVITRRRFERDFAGMLAILATEPATAPKVAELLGPPQSGGIFGSDEDAAVTAATEIEERKRGDVAAATKLWLAAKAKQQRAAARATRGKQRAAKAAAAQKKERASEAYERWHAGASQGQGKYFSSKHGRLVNRLKPMKAMPKRRGWQGPVDILQSEGAAAALDAEQAGGGPVLAWQ